MKKLLITSFCFLSLFLTGCSAIDMAKWQKELANDPATVTGCVTTIYGTVKFVRVGVTEPGQSITASPDGSVTVTNNFEKK